MSPQTQRSALQTPPNPPNPPSSLSKGAQFDEEVKKTHFVRDLAPPGGDGRTRFFWMFGMWQMCPIQIWIRSRESLVWSLRGQWLLLRVRPGSVSLPSWQCSGAGTGERQVGFRKERRGRVGVKGVRAAEGLQAFTCDKKCLLWLTNQGIYFFWRRGGQVGVGVQVVN